MIHVPPELQIPHSYNRHCVTVDIMLISYLNYNVNFSHPALIISLEISLNLVLSDFKLVSRTGSFCLVTEASVLRFALYKEPTKVDLRCPIHQSNRTVVLGNADKVSTLFVLKS